MSEAEKAAARKAAEIIIAAFAPLNRNNQEWIQEATEIIIREIQLAK